MGERGRQQNRGRDREQGRRGGAEEVSALLPKVLDELGLGEASTGAALLRAWDEVLGEPLASHCRPEGIRRGVLHARVRDSAWMQRLHLEKPRILARLANVLDEAAPSELCLRLGPLDH
ncbi:MAG: DUF721 domain-containing protein [Myxococcota bacterium]